MVFRVHLKKNPTFSFNLSLTFRPGPWDDKNLGTLKEANRIWAERMRAENSDFFVTKEQGHSPKILWIGCSDAR